MIQSFACKETENLFNLKGSRKIPTTIQRVAVRKLLQLHACTKIETLAVPPGNKLEALKGDRQGQHSIRINDQWRICFIWANGNAFDVEIVDYH